MIPVEQWLESWSDVIDDETNEVVSEGGTAYCMIAIATQEEWQLIKAAYPTMFATVRHGKNPITGEWDGRLDTYNVQWKTLDGEEFERMGGSKWEAEFHGFDQHPAYRRPKSVWSAA